MDLLILTENEKEKKKNVLLSGIEIVNQREPDMMTEGTLIETETVIIIEEETDMMIDVIITTVPLLEDTAIVQEILEQRLLSSLPFPTRWSD